MHALLETCSAAWVRVHQQQILQVLLVANSQPLILTVDVKLNTSYMGPVISFCTVVTPFVKL